MRIVRSIALRLAGVWLLAATLAQPVSAQELPAWMFTPALIGTAVSPQAVSPQDDQPRLFAGIFTIPEAAAPWIGTETQPVRTEPERPGALVPLYGSLVTLQALDIHSTYAALSHPGVSEVNPVMQPVVGNKAAFTLVKASTTAATVWLTEKMWKKNRNAAIVFAVAANATMAVVVAHNYRVAARQ